VNQPFHSIGKILPGLLLCFVVMLAGILVADWIGYAMIALGILSPESSTPISGIFVAILIGIIIRNTTGLADFFSKGISFSVKYALRAGIILLGFRLSLLGALKLGAFGIPLIFICIAVGLMVTLYLTRKMNQSTRLGTLIAGGTGICGVTAIMAIAPSIKAKEDEISYAVANITIFGLTSMMIYPFLAHLIFAGDPIKTGLFLGTAIHDTAQVTGAALIYDQVYQSNTVVDVATVTKLTRNLFIIIIIPLVSYFFYKYSTDNRTEDSGKGASKWYHYIPYFVLGFLFLSFLRTIGDVTLEQAGAAFGLFQAGTWETIYTQTSSIGSTYLLGMAMAGVGLSTSFSIFKGIGLKPFFIGFVAAVSIGIVSVTLISLFGDWVVL